MSRPVNPSVPEAGYKSKKQFEDTGSIAASDFAIVKDGNNASKIVFDASSVTAGATVTITVPSSGTVAIGSLGLAGANTQVQYNNNGSPGANSGFTYDGTNGAVTITGTGGVPLLVNGNSNTLAGAIFEVYDTDATAALFSVSGQDGFGDGNIDCFEILNMNTFEIIGAADPTGDQSVATKHYVDTRDFVSAEITGNGSAQNTAHGLGVTPSKVFVSVTAATGAFTVTEGTHTSTNCIVTLTNGVKYKIWAKK